MQEPFVMYESFKFYSFMADVNSDWSERERERERVVFLSLYIYVCNMVIV